jgi:outer membrane protein TolC
MRTRFTYSLIILLSSLASVNAQETDLLKKYRNMTLEYNQDLKAAEKRIEYSKEIEKSAKADFLAKLSLNADFNYTENPMELSMQIAGNSIDFQGENIAYGSTLSLVQPLYKGGMIRENSNMAKKNTAYAIHNAEDIKAALSYEIDSRYWSTVARKEMLTISHSFKQSMQDLVGIVKDRVDLDFANRNDLLMVEVKLNEADYQLIQANNNYELGKMSLNSLIGNELTADTPTDDKVPAIKSLASLTDSMQSVYDARAKILMAENNISIQESVLKIKDAKYKPQLYMGVKGGYSTPGYNFKSDLDANYAVYAKLSIPLFEWGKRKSEKRASRHKVNMAKDNYSKQKDMVALEVQSAFFAYNQAIKRVLLTESSLAKAVENEQMALDRYKGGSISLIELIDAQVFHQKADLNYVQSRMNAQIYRSQYIRALGVYKI